MYKINLLLIITLLLASCGKDKKQSNIKSKPLESKKNFNINSLELFPKASKNSNNIILKLQMDEPFCLTEFGLQYQVSQAMINPNIRKNIKSDKDFKKLFHSITLNIIENEILYQEALRIGNDDDSKNERRQKFIMVTPEELEREIQSRINKISQKEKIPFHNFLKKNRMSNQEFSKQIEKQLKTSKLMSYQYSLLKEITPKDIKEEYKKYTLTGMYQENFKKVKIIPFTKGEISFRESRELIKKYKKEKDFNLIFKDHISKLVIEKVPYKKSAKYKKHKSLGKKLHTHILNTQKNQIKFIDEFDKDYFIYVIEELEEPKQMSPAIHDDLSRRIRRNRQNEMRERLILKASNKAFLMIRQASKLIDVDLKEFLQDSWK